MKKILALILTSAIFLTFFAATTVSESRNITVELDGKKIEFDVKPEIIDGRTMVPLRKIFEEIGALVKWDSETQTVTARKNSKTITLPINSSDLQIDKGKTDDEGNPILETISLEVPAQIVSGRTLVPARAISESFGLNVDWNDENSTIIITSDDETDDSWKENIGTINLTNLTYEGKGIEIDGNQIKITAGGDYTLKGTLNDGNITISAKEKVKIRLSGVNITSANNPAIFVEKADKAYITISDGTENILVAQNSEDGAIYSKENLEIKGDGSLKIESKAGHGIKASDNLNIENGNITINATSDGIHINDTFKMSGGIVTITSINDGIDSESIINISGGAINIETNGPPIQPTQVTSETIRNGQRRGMWDMDEADVEFEKSTKGINAEWMLVISDGEININSASHAIHCQDEIEINGGKFTLSSKYDKGISAHGNLTIGGELTEINVTKSTEGIESKNVMTINNGIIKVVSTDDALNATGGSSGMMMPGGNFGGNGGGNRIRPEANTNTQPGQKSNNTEPPARPNRDENARSGEARQNRKPFENGEFTPAEMNGEPETFSPPFNNGEFTPPSGNRPQMDEGGMFPGGNFGGMGRDMKVCLVINDGYIELYGEDDCLDSNGNMVINGGTIKAIKPDGSIYGAFGIVDPDGKSSISENATLIFAAGNGNARSLGLTQNTITVNCEASHETGDKITVSDNNGNIVFEYTPNGRFKTVLIASNKIKTEESYSIEIGNESFEAKITEQNTVIGTQTNGGFGFGRGQNTF